MRAVRDAGYRTSSFGKLHLTNAGRDVRLSEQNAQRIGFDTVNETLGPRGCMNRITHMTQAWADAGVLEDFRIDIADRLANDPLMVRPSPLPLELYYDVYVPSQAVDHLRSLPPNEPWFCNVGFGGPHEPWDAPEPYASMFSPADAPDPIRPANPDNHTASYFLDHAPSMGGGRTPEQIAEMRANYAGAVRLIDDQIGRLLEVVRERGEWDRTVVVITSDHGEMNGDHGRVYKGTFFSAALDIPLILRIPGRTRGARSSVPVELHDVGPTLAEVADAPLEHEQFARSLTATCDDPTVGPRSVAIAEFRRDYLVADQRHRLIVNREGDSVLFFDRELDPTERYNHLGQADHRQIEAELRDQLFRAITHAQKSVRAGFRGAGYRQQRDTAQRILDQS